MDQTTPVILSVEVPDYQQIIIEASDGYRYTSELSRFSNVHCFTIAQLSEWLQIPCKTIWDWVYK